MMTILEDRDKNTPRKETLTSAVPGNLQSLWKSSGFRATAPFPLHKESHTEVEATPLLFKESRTTAGPSSQVGVLEANRPASKLRSPPIMKGAQPQGTLATWLQHVDLSNSPPPEPPKSSVEHSRSVPESPATALPTMDWTLSIAERKNYAQIFRAWDAQDTGFITGQAALEVFGQSGLEKNDLAKIWYVREVEG